MEGLGLPRADPGGGEAGGTRQEGDGAGDRARRRVGSVRLQLAFGSYVACGAGGRLSITLFSHASWLA